MGTVKRLHLILTICASKCCGIGCRLLMSTKWTSFFSRNKRVTSSFWMRDWAKIFIFGYYWVTSFLQRISLFLDCPEMSCLWRYWLSCWRKFLFVNLFIFLRDINFIVIFFVVILLDFMVFLTFINILLFKSLFSLIMWPYLGR